MAITGYDNRVTDLRTLCRRVFDIPAKYLDVRTDSEVYDAVRSHLQARLNAIEEEHKPTSTGYDDTDGRIGPETITMVSCGAGELRSNSGTGQLESTSNFATAMGNVGVINGKWMYEATLCTCGIQQLGWATMKCSFTSEEGVGDTHNSYAFDGKRRRKWNSKAEAYGLHWAPGDTVGVCIDMGAREVSFHLNGQDMGVAFKDVRTFEPHLAYFPAVSLSQSEMCTVNMGARPFQFPVEGFRPLMCCTDLHRVKQCDALLGYMRHLAEADVSQSSNNPDESERVCPMNPDETELLSSPASKPRAIPGAGTRASTAASPALLCAQRVLLASVIAELLGPLLLSPSAITLSALPFLHALHSPPTPSSRNLLMPTPFSRVLSLLEASLEVHELNKLSIGLFSHLATLSMTCCSDLENNGSASVVHFAADLLRRKPFMRELVRSTDFVSDIEKFMFVKRPESRKLKEMLPEVSWPYDASKSDEAQSSFKANLAKLCTSYEAIQAAQVQLLTPLLLQPACALKNSIPSSLRDNPKLCPTAFHGLVQHLVRKNLGVLRQVPPSGLSSNTVLVNVFYVVLWLLGPALAQPMRLSNGSASVRGTCAASPHSCPSSPRVGTDKTAAAAADVALLALNREDPTRSASGPLPGAKLAAPQTPGRGGRAARGHHVGVKLRSCSLWKFPAVKLFVPDTAPVDSSRDRYLGMNRVGGLVSEAMKNVPAAAERKDVDLSSFAMEISSAGDGPHSAHSDTPPQMLGKQAHTLVDLAVLLYPVGMQVAYQRMSSQVRLVSELHAKVAKLKSATPADSASASSKEKHRETLLASQTEFHREVRTLEFQQSVGLHGGWKSTAVSQLVLYISHLLLQIQSDFPNVWTHVPEMFLECAVCSYHALQRTQASALSPTTDCMAVLLTELLIDTRLVSPYMHDVILQSIANLLSNRLCLAVVQDNAHAMARLVPRLMQLYNQDHWMTLTPIFLKLVGRDDASRRAPTAHPPSGICFRIKQLCLQRTPAATSFVNQLFSALDWAATEVTVSLRELSGSRSHSASLRRRLLVLFSISTSCCQLLEFLVSEVSSVFLSGPPLLASKLSEMLAFLSVHAPVDGTSREFRTLRDVSGGLDRSASRRSSHPLALAAAIVAMLTECWRMERGEPGFYGQKINEQRKLASGDDVPDTIKNSIVNLLMGMHEALPLAALENLRKAPWPDREVPPREVASHMKDLSALEEMIECFKAHRAQTTECDAGDCPEDFLDPIMMVPMTDPVRLPDSNVVVDRVTIERHLLVNPRDPFNRTDLTVDMVIDDKELKARIDAWRAQQGAGALSAARAQDISSHIPDSWELDSASDQ